MQIAPGTLISARALLFDMDGTLVDSTVAVERVWNNWATSHGVSFSDVAHRMHGRRAIDIMRDLAPPGLDLEKELKIVDDNELNDTDGIVHIAGAAELLASLPRGSWALVTSAQRSLACARMTAGGLPLPEVIVTSDDVSLGKPNPDCYQLALERLGLRPEDVVVFEDALAGLAAGRAAGCRTIAIASTIPTEDLDHEDWLYDLSRLRLESVADEGLMQFRVC
jgi:mannitol-1-/sugar-/sorbitol-6-phosphatase